ncbi:MAG TPA: hypothetical protein VFB21_00920 [Chthonomonadaceae bacterium]|nr:hypothetical protein [Chthonomonadaceae bacterium]
MPTGYGSGDNQFSARHRDFDPEWLARDTESTEDDALWDLLSAYRDGEATAEEAALVEARLRSDPAYARDFEFLKRTSEAARAYVEVEPPASLRESIFAATTQRQTFAGRVAAGWDSLRRALAPNWGTGLAVGGLAAAAVLGLLFWPRPHSDNAPPPLTVKPGTASPPQVAQNPKPSGKRARPSQPKAVPATQIVRHREEPRRNRERKTMQATVELAALHSRTNRPRSNEPRLALNLNKPLPVRRLKPLHYPKIDAQNDPLVAFTRYSPRPNMDASNQKQTWPTTRDDAAAPLNDNVVVEAAPPAVDKTLPAATNPATSNDTPKVASAGLSRRFGRILRTAQLPPDPRLIVSNGDLKRQRAAATLGYDRDTLESIQRRQPTVSLISSRF